MIPERRPFLAIVLAPSMAPTSKLLRLPDRGRLLVAADLHGNLRDFLTVVAVFERMFAQSPDNELFLLFLGDLLHGPYLPLAEWRSAPLTAPFLCGRPYRDQSPAILLEISELMARYPGRIFTLLGNHEHAHIGGPRTSLFARDETAALEQRLGVEASLWLTGFLKGLPLLALAPCGLLFSHAAPAGDLACCEDLEGIDYRRYASSKTAASKPEGADGRPSRGDAAARLLGQLLWTSSLSPEQARTVLSRIGARVAIYGHTVIPAGYQTIGSEQLILSSSFGTEDAQKRILLVDLAGEYASTEDLRPEFEILPLYPPPYR